MIMPGIMSEGSGEGITGKFVDRVFENLSFLDFGLVYQIRLVFGLLTRLRKDRGSYRQG
jgi:hypothetical protein